MLHAVQLESCSLTVPMTMEVAVRCTLSEEGDNNAGAMMMMPFVELFQTPEEVMRRACMFVCQTRKREGLEEEMHTLRRGR